MKNYSFSFLLIFAHAHFLRCLFRMVFQLVHCNSFQIRAVTKMHLGQSDSTIPAILLQLNNNAHYKLPVGNLGSSQYFCCNYRGTFSLNLEGLISFCDFVQWSPKNYKRHSSINYLLCLRKDSYFCPESIARQRSISHPPPLVT